MGGKSGSVTTGYRYFMGLHFGFCTGPVDALTKIRVGERDAWSGNATANVDIAIDAANLFGGEQKEGGIKGTFSLMMGDAAQTANAYLTAQQGSPQPAYRGILTGVYRGLVACNNPYVKSWEIRVRRILAGWSTGAAWYSAKASIVIGSITAANPAHIIYECLTNSNWGLGYPVGQLDNASFTSAADAFYAEGLGLCLAWTQQDSILNFVQVILDHAGAALSENPITGQFQLRAIRQDYVAASLPLFSDATGNIIRMNQIDRSSFTEAVNEIVVAYVDATTGKDASITVQNLASVQNIGAVVSQSRDYPGIPTAALAARLAVRDVKATSSGLARVSFVANRDGYAIAPGDAIQLTWTPSGISQMVLRVARIDYGTLQDGEIKIEAVEDVFGLPSTVYAGAPSIAWTEPDTTPQPAAANLTLEADYRSLRIILGAADSAALTSVSAYVLAGAAKPSTAYSYNFTIDSRAGSASYVSRSAVGDWMPVVTLDSSITATTTSLVVTGDLSLVLAGTAAMLGTGATAEIVRIDSVTGQTLVVGRGCVDTTPRAWAAATVLWSFEDYALSDQEEYVSGETVSVRYITQSPQGALAAGSAPVGTVTMTGRQARPYPPGRPLLNGVAYPATITGATTISWAHRDRVGQVEKLIDATDSSYGPEAGTTYSLRIYGTANAVIKSVDGITTTSYVWSDYSASTVALLHFNGANGSTTFTDESGSTWTAVANAQLSTAQAKFGTASLLLDGATDYISRSGAALAAATGDFTIESWVYLTAGNTGDRVIVATGNASACLTIGLLGNKFVCTAYAVGYDATSVTSIPTGQWVHLAAARSGTTLRLFINGVVDVTATVSRSYSSGGPMVIGGQGAGSAYTLFGYIDEVRVFIGTCKYTANFTPATTEFAFEPGTYDPSVSVELWSVRNALASYQKQALSTTRVG